MWDKRELFLSFFMSLHIATIAAAQDLYQLRDPTVASNVFYSLSDRPHPSMVAFSSSLAEQSSSSAPRTFVGNDLSTTPVRATLSSSAGAFVASASSISLARSSGRAPLVNISLPLLVPSQNTTTSNHTTFFRIPLLVPTASSSPVNITSIVNQLFPSSTGSPVFVPTFNRTTTASSTLRVTSHLNTTSMSTSSKTTIPTTVHPPTQTTTTSPPTSSPTFTSLAAERKDFSKAQLAGTVAGTVVAASLTVACLFYLWRRRKQNVQRAEHELESESWFGSGKSRATRGTFPESAWLYDPLVPITRPPASATHLAGAVGPGRARGRSAVGRINTDIGIGSRLSRVYEEERNPFADRSEAGLLAGRSRSTSAAGEEDAVRRPRSGTFELEDTQVEIVPGSAL